MTLKRFTGFNTLFTTPVIIAVTTLGFWVVANWAVPAGPSYQPRPDRKRSEQHPLVVAQRDTQTPTAEKTAPSSESSASESKTQEKKESDGTRQKPLKEFRPSERIEAEQAVDFPYDI